MPHWRPIRDRQSSSETHQRPTSFIRDVSCPGFVFDQTRWSSIRHVGLRWGMLVFNGSLIRHVCLRSGMLVSDETCQSQMGLRSGMSVSDGSSIRHIGLWWGMSVPDQTCRSPKGLRSGMSVSISSPIRNVGLRWVYDQACWSPTGLQWVFDRSPIVIIFSCARLFKPFKVK